MQFNLLFTILFTLSYTGTSNGFQSTILLKNQKNIFGLNNNNNNDYQIKKVLNSNNNKQALQVDNNSKKYLNLQKSFQKISLFASTSSDNDNDNDTTITSNNKFDYNAIIKYISAITIQMSIFLIMLQCLDKIQSILPISKNIQFIINFILFYGLSLKSRIFNPLSNFRPNPKTLESKSDNDSDDKKDNKLLFKRNMPKWTPPGITFPIVWLLLIGPLRAYTASLIIQTTGLYTCIPILAFLLHLSIGDVWNTINNVERRYGFSCIGVIFVWLSKAFASYQYYLVNPYAGKLLSLSLLWLTIASTLVISTWKLNPITKTNKLDTLYPNTSNEIKTKFVWFTK